MALTNRFGLHKFGGGLGGAITDDGQAFTATDPDIVDAVLAAFESHRHVGGARLGDPSAGPTLTQASSGGSLAANSTFYYRVSFIDEFGLETAASDEAFASTPGTVDRPGMPLAVTIAGGSLPTGVYYYGLTAIAGANETSLGSVTPITITDQNTVELTFPLTPDGADHISVWRQGQSEAYFSRIATVDLSSDTFDDDGSVLADPIAYDPAHQPPTTNLTNATSVITITVPDAVAVAADPSLVKAWRVYRSMVSGAYPPSSLLAEIYTTVNEDGTGGLVTTFADNGAVTITTGGPLSLSQTLTPTASIAAGAVGAMSSDLPDAGQFRDGTLAVTTTDHKLWAAIAGAWVSVGGSGGSGAVDSHFVSAPVSLIVGTSGTPVPLSTVAIDNNALGVTSVGYDLSCVGIVDAGAGDELQVNTDGVYSASVALVGSGFTAGDIVEVDFIWQFVKVGVFIEDTTTGFHYRLPHKFYIPVLPDGSIDSGVVLPSVFMPAWSRLSVQITPHYVGTTPIIAAQWGMSFVSGKAAVAEVYSGVNNMSVDSGTSGFLTVTWDAPNGSSGVTPSGTYNTIAYNGTVVVWSGMTSGFSQFFPVPTGANITVLVAPMGTPTDFGAEVSGTPVVTTVAT